MLKFSAKTNRLSTITNHNSGKTISVEQQLWQYVPTGGMYRDGQQVYVFAKFQNETANDSCF